MNHTAFLMTTHELNALPRIKQISLWIFIVLTLKIFKIFQCINRSNSQLEFSTWNWHKSVSKLLDYSTHELKKLEKNNFLKCWHMEMV